MLDLKSDFPSLYSKDFAFLDTAASAQKPKVVIDAMSDVMSNHYANIHRGMYDYSQKTTSMFENVRVKIQKFINAKSQNEVVFTKNSTDAINLIAQSYGRAFLKDGDEVIISQMEHHANIVPWQLLRDQIGIVIKVIPLTETLELDYEEFKNLLNDRTKIVSITQISNALGIVNNINKISKITKNFNPDIKLVIDGSQGIVHGRTDVQALDCDFYVFTGHKLYGPSGIGILWGREDILNSMPPYQGGGDMIEDVTFEHTTYKNAPSRFEAGTPSIVDVIGLGAAIDYVSKIGMEAIASHENALLLATMDRLDGVRVYGDVENKAPIISFSIDGVHHSDIAMILNQSGVAVRTGHHCCMPLMQHLGIDGTVRASFGLYNDLNDVKKLITGLGKVRKLLL